jgi:hypothetical protein
MTDDQRRAFDNLLLLCTPHHTLIDRVRPDDFPVETLRGWKVKRELEGGVDTATVATLTEENLLERIETAIAATRATRTVTVELGLGVWKVPHQLIQLPFETASEELWRYKQYGPAVVFLTARSLGNIKAYVDRHALCIIPAEIRLSGNEFTAVNPPLPAELDIGESKTWLYDLDRIISAVMATRAVLAKDRSAKLIAEVTLGSGETVSSDGMQLNYLLRE